MGHNDRVAIVLKNGPAMAACFLAVSGGATAAPLNPAYKSEEFEFYLTDLEPKILVIEEGELSPAIEVAAKLESRWFGSRQTPSRARAILRSFFPMRWL